MTRLTFRTHLSVTLILCHIHNCVQSFSIQETKGGVVVRSSFLPRQSRVSETALYSKTIYSLPALYDLAFDYRDYEREVDFLLQVHERYAQQPARNVLELAAGPARHSLEALFVEHINSVTALDQSVEMRDYSLRNLESDYDFDNPQRIQDFEYLLADMRSVPLPKVPYDTAWILLGSLQHLTTNDDVLSCFKSVYEALTPGGTLILELPHPRETFSMVECTRNGWTVPLETNDVETTNQNPDACLEIVWGDDQDVFDPIQQVRQFTVSMELKGMEDSEDLQSVRQIVPMRLFTTQEIDALARCAGLDVVALYGALDEDVRIDNEDEAFRLVCVLKKNVD